MIIEKWRKRDLFEFPLDRNINAQFAAIQTFLNEWHDGVISKEKNDVDIYPQGNIPLALSKFYNLLKYIPTPICVQNELTSKEKLIERNGMTIFYTENQGVYHWAFREKSDNPQVYGRLNEADQDWKKENEKLACFLYQICLFETTFGAQYGASASWLEKNDLKKFLSEWEIVPYGDWLWPSYPTKFYFTRGALAVVSPNEDVYSVWCGSKEPNTLSFIEKYIDDTWEYVHIRNDSM